jgi:hypothetical protein
VPHIVAEVHKKGKWNYDIIKFIAVGIPLLYVLLYLLTVHFSPVLLHIYPIALSAVYSYNITTVCGVAFGYFALSSLNKHYY